MPGRTPDTERRVSPSEAYKVDARADVRVAELAAEQWSELSLDELRACGLSRNAVAVRVRNGRLHRMHRGVYAVGHDRPPLKGRFLGAVKACGPGAALSHFAAAALWNFVEWVERFPEVTVVRAGTRLQRGITVHRTAALSPHDLRWRDGIRLTAPARTLLDLAAVLREASLRQAVRRAQGLNLVRIDELAEVIRRLGPRRGSRRLARVIATGAAPARTVLEDVVLDLLLEGGLAHPDVNKPLRLDGRRVIPDFRWPAQRLVIEADGVAWHDQKVAREDDTERQALLEAHGERVLRVTWRQAVGEPGRTLARIRAAGAPPATAGSRARPRA